MTRGRKGPATNHIVQGRPSGRSTWTRTTFSSN